MSGDTALFPYSVTFANGQYEIDQPTNGTLVSTFPISQSVLKTHPTAATLFYFGTNGNIIPLDYTLCTNLANGSRLILMQAIEALAAGSPLGSVTIAGQPISVNLNPAATQQVLVSQKLTNIYSLQATVPTGIQTALILRPNGGSVRLLRITGASAAALSSGVFITVQQGVTITGGTYATPSVITGSIMQVNTGGSSSGGTSMLDHAFNSTGIFDISLYNIVIATLVPFTIIMTSSGLGSSSVTITWTE